MKPGDDFDRYANGTWADKTEIPADQTSAGVWDDVRNRCQDQLRSLVEGSARSTQIGGLYGSFMDEARVETLGAKRVETDLTKIAAVENKEEFAKVLGRALSGFGAPLYGLVVTPDPKRPDLNVLAMGQAGLGLPDRDYYLIPTFKPQLDAYRAFIERALTMIKYADPSGSAAAVIDLETRIARASWRSEESRDIEKMNNPMSLSELKTYAAGFPWEPYLSAAGVSNPGRMLVTQNSAIKAIASVYAETPLPVWKAWEAFHTVSEASPYLSKAFVDSDFVFTKALIGVSTLRPRWKRGVERVNWSLGEAVGHAYVDRYFPPSSKAAMQEMIGHLKKAMGSRIRARPG